MATKTKNSKSKSAGKAKTATKGAKASAPTVTKPKESAEAKAAREAATAERKEAKQQLHLDRIDTVLELRDEQNESWAGIAEQMEIDPGRARQYYMIGRLKKSERYTGTDEEIAAQIVAGRDDEQLAWGELTARVFHSRGYSQSTVKGIYEETSGSSANQGFAVVQARAAERAAAGEATKVKKGSTKTSKATKNAKAGKKGSNPSKG